MSFISNDTETFILIIAGVWYLYNKLIHMVYSFLKLVLPVQNTSSQVEKKSLLETLNPRKPLLSNPSSLKWHIATGSMWVKLYDTIALAAKTMIAQHWHHSEERGVGGSTPWTFYTLISSSPYSAILLSGWNVDVSLCQSKASSRGTRTAWKLPIRWTALGGETLPEHRFPLISMGAQANSMKFIANHLWV